jgi:hypothetical protein
MAYTPQLSMKSSRTLRRIAWALNIPMTRAIEEVFDFLGKTLDGKKICEACKDKSRCDECLFSPETIK